jgi:hypothetical protein
MLPWSKTLLEAEDSLRELEESISRVRTEWPVSGGNVNGAAGDGAPGAETLRQLASELSNIVRQCEELPTAAITTVESAWGNLEANKLPDWDAVGHSVLKLLGQQAEAMAQVANLLRRGERIGLPNQAPGKLSTEQSLLLHRARDFRDSWPWSTGNKPDDDEDAAAAQNATHALPSFESLSRLAEKFPPPPEWLNGE